MISLGTDKDLYEASGFWRVEAAVIPKTSIDAKGESDVGVV